MNITKHKTATFVASAALTVAFLMGATSTRAHGMWGVGGDGTTSIVDRLVERFKLSKPDVQKVFDEVRTERQAALTKAFETRLTELVTAGTITDAQKKLILAKHAELQKTMMQEKASWATKTLEERRTLMEAKRAELTAWATQNGIDLQQVTGLLGGKGAIKGMGIGWGR